MSKVISYGAIAVLALLASGCSTFNSLSDYVSSNPLIASTATRIAVSEYIAAGATIEEEIDRAKDVQVRVNAVIAYLDGDPTAASDELMQVIDRAIEWGKLGPRDRILVEAIVAVVEQELSKAEADIELSEKTKVVISAMLETAVSAASHYLSTAL